MARYTVSILAIVLAVVISAQSASFLPQHESKNSKELTFIGSVKTYIPGAARGLGRLQETKYFKSADSTFWHIARQDCIDLIGGTLAYIETREELANITKFLDDGTTATLYWIGAEYDIIEEQFFWGNREPVSPDAPWAPNHPNAFFETTRVELYTPGGGRFRSQDQNTPRRYLCEIQTEECLGSVDINKV